MRGPRGLLAGLLSDEVRTSTICTWADSLNGDPSVVVSVGFVPVCRDSDLGGVEGVGDCYVFA